MLAVALRHLGGHYIEEVVEVNSDLALLVPRISVLVSACEVIVLIAYQLLDLLFLRLEAECSQRHFEILQVDAALPVGIEEIEGLFDLSLLGCCQLLLVSFGLCLLLSWAAS